MCSRSWALLKRKKAAALRASTAGPVVATPVAIHVDVMSDVQRGRTKAEADAAAKKKAPATKGPTATGDATTYSVELTKTPMWAWASASPTTSSPKSSLTRKRRGVAESRWVIEGWP